MRTSIFITATLLASAVFGVQPAIADGVTPPESLSALFKRVDDAVVVVHTSERIVTRDSNRTPVSMQALGSGVLVAGGKVLTAAHVVQTADAVMVEFPHEVRVRARIIASDPAADLALLQLESVPAGIAPVELGDSDQAEVGDPVFVVGAPFGITHTLTVGHVSARRKSNITSAGMVETELFQTDAAINHGNSGGPMFNMHGEVIGVVSHIISTSGGSEGLGFVVTSNVARDLLFARPTAWSGIEGYVLRGDLARAFNIPAPGVGLLVQRVAAGSPAERLGIRGGSVTALIEDEQLVLGGDVILAVQGVAFGSPDAYDNIRRRLSAIPPGGAIRLAVLRRGEVVELSGAVPR
jgi:S1-C subfamily serine protease